MKTASVTEFKQRAKELLKEIEDDQDILIISRPKNQMGFVVLPMDQYDSLQETAHLLSTQANAQHLWESIAQHKAGNLVSKALIEPDGNRAVRAKSGRAVIEVADRAEHVRVLGGRRFQDKQAGGKKKQLSKAAPRAKKK